MIPSAGDDRERASIEAALGCALFCDAGTQSRTFALHSYAEFLAANYLSEFPLTQVLDLLCIREGEQRFVVPQVAEVSAWLVLQHNDFLEWVIGHEPEILLRNDASSLTESQRSRFVEALLRRMAKEEAFDDWDLKRFYGSFRHPGLPAQLRPYLADKGCSRFARRAAIHLAGLGKLRDTAGDAAMVIALALVLFPHRFWGETLRFAKDKALAEASLQIVADLHASLAHKPLESLLPEQLSNLFSLLEETFPSTNPVKLPRDEVSVRERVEKLRYFIPQRLQELASSEACQHLLRLADRFPHQRTLLRWNWRRGRITLLRNAWPGVPPEVIMGIAAKRESRWITRGDDLFELIVDAIARFQTNLNQTEFPEVRDLWNESPELRPKDESALTQKVVRWLRDYLGPKNGVALGCQVEPSPVHETDIEVRARPGTPKPTDESFVVTIEVKCSFNQEVATSLEKQLVGEYLLKLSRKHGIYLVGWYRGEGWKPSRNPLGAETWEGASAKVEELLTSSQSLHPELSLGTVCLNCEFPQAFRKRS